MKKKLLITLGDSYTEGVGCYPQKYLELDDKEFFSNDSIYSDSLNNFHEFGWPNKLGKKLNYDKVINLGLGGSSACSNVKNFYEKYLTKDLSDYEVLIIWFLPSSVRTSFYFNGKIESRMPFSNQASPFDIEYLKRLMENDTHELNCTLNQVFHIKTMEQACENLGYKLLLFHTDKTSHNSMRKIYDSKYLLTKDDSHVLDGIGNENYAPCFHPNEQGYEIVSNNIFNLIEKYYPSYINKETVEKFEWVYDGYVTPIHMENQEIYDYFDTQVNQEYKQFLDRIDEK